MLRQLLRVPVRAGLLGLVSGVVGLASPTASAIGPGQNDKPAKSEKPKPKPKQSKQKKGKGAIDIDMPVQSFTLDNGLRVYVIEDHSTPTFSVHTAYNVGSRDEEPGRTGFAHLFEHMMFKGSKNVPEGGHFKYVLDVGGKTNAFTSADVTQYYNVVPSHYLDRIMWLESDRMRALEITDENFENQRTAVREEKATRYDNAPYAGVLVHFFAGLWKGTGYGHPTMGSVDDLNAAETKDVQAFFNRHYVPNNAVMSIVGDVRVSEVKKKVNQYFASIPRGADRAAFTPIEHKQEKIEVVKEDPLARQPLYVIGWKTVPEHHVDAKALDLLMSVLLRGESSRVTRILKDEKKLVITSVPIVGLAGGREAGVASAAFIPVEGASFQEIKRVVKDEVERVRKKGITRKELKKVRNQTAVDTIGSMATNTGRAMMVAQGALFYDDPKRVLTDLEQYQAVTAADIKRVANTYLTDKWIVLEIKPKK